MSDREQLSFGFGSPGRDEAEGGVSGSSVQDREVISLGDARSAGLFSVLDWQFATRLAALMGESREELIWSAALVCRQESQGHVCADLERLLAEGLLADEEGELRFVAAGPEGLDAKAWASMLRSSPLVGEAAMGVGSDQEGALAKTPLILDDARRLYLRRSFEDQQCVARALTQRLEQPDLYFSAEDEEAAIARFMGSELEEDPARDAMRMGLRRPLSVVTGGPGTGKTTLVARLVAALIEARIACGKPPPVVRLLAPTGKAAAAMTASFARQRDHLGLSAEAKSFLPSAAETIHRALMPLMWRDAFGRARDFSLGADVVVVDEASMVDLSLMRRLFEACSDTERIILLGDPDQLASVDSGAVLAELCKVAAELPSLSRSRVHLERSHRFASGGSIGLLADAIRQGDADRALELLDDESHAEVTRRNVDSVASVRAHLAEISREMQEGIRAAAGPGEKLERLTSSRVLCAHRRGLLGSVALCEFLDAAGASARETTSRSGWWQGRLLLVTRNAPEQDLWNGDVGLVEEMPGGLRALFPNREGGIRTLSAGRLPAFESAIAMSVHKSQGSEFDSVELVLGAQISGLMTRELLYTGVTRARERLCLHASEEVIRAAIGRRIERDSGLADALRAEA